MSPSNHLTFWRHWVQQPQKIWLRRALFQVHLWSGIAVGLYILIVSVTGSVLVYRNELYRAATAEPIISKSLGPRMTDDQLKATARRLYPGYRVVRLGRALDLDQAVDVWLSRAARSRRGSSILGVAAILVIRYQPVSGSYQSYPICTTICSLDQQAGK